MKKRILTLFCVLALLVMLAIPAFAASISPTPANPIQAGNYSGTSSRSGNIAYFYPNQSITDQIITITKTTGNCDMHISLYSGGGLVVYDFGIISGTLTFHVSDYISYNFKTLQINPCESASYSSVSFSMNVVDINFSVSPSFANPIQAGDYIVSDLYGEQSAARMYPNPSWSASAFAFSSVTAPTGTTVKAHTSSGSVTVGTLANGFSFRSSDYPAADYFFVDNQTITPASYTVSVSAINFGVSPAFANPIQPGEYTVSDLIGTQTVNRMYTTRDDPKTFTFTDVAANASTVVSYAIASEGGTISYHNIGTLTEGFTFSSADYPVASFFTVRNTGSSLASYTVTVENDSFEKSQGIAKSIWETCLEMGAAAIDWITDADNFIVLIPLAMFLLVGAVLMIRKLIKGV